MSDVSQGQGWWLASDGKWYPPAESSAPDVATPVPWATVATVGTLVLAQSPYEYAVYDQTHSYGRWPKTEEGYRYACFTYGAHAQSLAHGLAYTATGYQDPERLGLPTEPAIKSQSYAAPLSFIGSARRIWAWAKGTARRSPVSTVLVRSLAVIGIILAWLLVACWYLVIFGLFGILVIPYRLIRRSQRKSLHVQRTTLATQQAMYQQMAAMQGGSGPQLPSHGTPGSPSPGFPVQQAPSPQPLPPPSGYR